MSNEESPIGLDGVAVIGMCGRFPGAADVAEFWRNLRDGVESISFFTEAELAAAGVSPAALRQPNYVWARAILDDIETFDAAFFGFTPREAEVTDPQQRLFLECMWAALERAGYNSETYQGSIGVYGGVSISSYLLNNLYPNRAVMESVDSLRVLLG
ncbi:MAG TPA: beta-ketoacyl synthase N-terminal-like domain-containing protein, partial [Pyrinomonadaceae bacterium]|nr:beta-ketoacyl synthase N-terminal-like domain-containing protein [Pyrinomonadaceae bacterium]